MVAGRPRKPTTLKRLAGNPGRKPLPEKEPKVDGVKPCPPPKRVKLQKHAAEKWRQLMPIVTEMDVMSLGDMEMFGNLCIELGKMDEALEMIKQQGKMVKKTLSTGVVVKARNEWLTIYAEAAKAAKGLAGEFGLTPATRGKFGITPGKKNDPLAEFLGKAH